MKLCPSCGKPNHDSAESCIFCSEPMSGKKKEDDFEKQLLNGLDPLDQFLVTKAQSDDLEVEELASFSGDYDHIEDELDDAQRKADLHRKLQLIRGSKGNQGDPAAPPPEKADTATKVDAIEALLFGTPDQVHAATPSAPPPPPLRSKLSAGGSEQGETPPNESPEAKKDRVEKLEKYKKYIEEKTAPRMPSVGDNQAQQIIAYLESKISAQALEIEDLKNQKNELVKEVFSEALEEEHADYEGIIQELRKKLANAEAKVNDLADKREASDVKLLKMRDELERLRGGGGDLMAEKIRKEVSADFASLLDEQAKEHKAALLKRDAEWQEAFRKKQAEGERQLTDERQKAETLEEQLQDALAMAASASDSSTGEELDAMRQQVAKKAIEVTSLREKLGSSAERIQGLSTYYKGILGQISDGVVVVDAREKLFYINSAACNIMGFRPSESESRSLSEIPELALLTEYVHGIQRGESFADVEIAFMVAGVTANAILSAQSLRFVNQDLCVLRMRRPQSEGGGLSLLSDLPAPSLERIQESLFSLRILVELCRSKYQQPETVLELSEQIFTEINQLLDFVNLEKS